MNSLYPTNIEEKLGFEDIRNRLKERCLSNLGVLRVDKMRFINDYEKVNRYIDQTVEFKSILESEDSFPTNNFIDVSNALKKSNAEGAFLSERELLDICYSLKAILKSIDFLTKRKGEYPSLCDLSDSIDFDQTLADEIEEKIDKEARVKDHASPELRKIRSNLKSGYSRVKKLIDKIFKEASGSGYVPEGFTMTVRDGRMVIPIAAEHKRKIKGFIHDESSTGNTVFLEPTAVLEGNNELRELENAEKREVAKILTALTDRVRLNLPELKKAYNFLGNIDFIRAKAVFSQKLDATKPKLSDKPQIYWQLALHPLLFLSYKEANREVVPLSLALDNAQKIIVISGPNAGGKSVCLKTVGLLQYMLQCGLLIPVDPDSKAGVFDKIFIDIGDEQSLDNDLSTYSSHLTNMKYFLRNSSSETLILIDEFGTGTDPQFGGAIAEAILDKLRVSGCMGVITTHYSNIKHYAEEGDGIINGAMKFDMKKLEPLYQLEVGKPGSSFSLEISRKIGLDQQVLDYAKNLIGSERVDVDELILKLEKQHQEIAKRDKDLKESEQKVKSLEQKYSSLYEELEKNKKEILSKAKGEASDLLKKTNREIEKTIRHIKENKAHKGETKKARERLDELKERVNKKDNNNKNIAQPKSGPVEIGCQVKLKDNDVVGEVLSIKGKDVEVKMGGLKSFVKLNRLIKVGGPENNKQKFTKKRTRGFDIAQKRAHFNSTLDLRGKRAEEALPMVDKFIDDALLFNNGEVKILHGKGNGILKDLIRQHLKGAPYIETMKDEHIEHGGAGITVVNFK